MKQDLKVLKVTVDFIATREGNKESLIYHIYDPSGNEVKSGPFPEVGEGEFFMLQVARAFGPYIPEYEKDY